MSAIDEVAVVTSFNEAINAQDLDRLDELMTAGSWTRRRGQRGWAGACASQCGSGVGTGMVHAVVG